MVHPESQLQRQLERIGAVQLTSSLSAHASTQGDGGQVRTLKAALKGTSEKVQQPRRGLKFLEPINEPAKAHMAFKPDASDAAAKGQDAFIRVVPPRPSQLQELFRKVNDTAQLRSVASTFPGSSACTAPATPQGQREKVAGARSVANAPMPAWAVKDKGHGVHLGDFVDWWLDHHITPVGTGARGMSSRALASRAASAAKRLPPTRDGVTALERWLQSQVDAFNTASLSVAPEEVEDVATVAEQGLHIYATCHAELARQVATGCQQRGDLLGKVCAGMNAVFLWALKAMATLHGRAEAKLVALGQAVEYLERQNERWHGLMDRLKCDLMSQRRRGRGRHRRHPGQGGEGAEAEVDETGEEFVPFNADIPMPFQSAAANGEEAEGDEANPGPFPSLPESFSSLHPLALTRMARTVPRGLHHFAPLEYSFGRGDEASVGPMSMAKAVTMARGDALRHFGNFSFRAGDRRMFQQATSVNSAVSTTTEESIPLMEHESRVAALRARLMDSEGHLKTALARVARLEQELEHKSELVMRLEAFGEDNVRLREAVEQLTPRPSLDAFEEEGRVAEEHAAPIRDATLQCREHPTDVMSRMLLGTCRNGVDVTALARDCLGALAGQLRHSGKSGARDELVRALQSGDAAALESLLGVADRAAACLSAVQQGACPSPW